MSRQEDFIEAAYNNDRESSKQEQQFFVEGCEYGYQYAVDKACEWLSARLLTLQKGKFEDEFRKAMQ